MTPYTGSCLCGQVRYEVAGPFEAFFLCHCRYCQKDTGSAHAANLFSSTAELRWRSGSAHVRTFALPGTRHVRAFCDTCGSALPWIELSGPLLVVPAGSLDVDPGFAPQAHLFEASRAAWDRDLERLPRLDGLPS